MQDSQDFKLRDYNPKEKVVHSACTNKSGGISFKKPKKGNLLSIINTVSKRLVKSGLRVMELVLPAVLFYPRTQAEIILQGYCFMAKYLAIAAKIEDPVERIKYAISGSIANLTLVSESMQGDPPISNRPGETTQAVLPDGCRGYVEQLTAKRPDVRLQIYGPDESFILNANMATKITVRGINPNKMKGQQVYPFFVKFKDGIEYKVTLAKYDIDGCLGQDKSFTFNGSFEVVDLTNDIVATATIPKSGTGMLKNLGGFFSKKPKYDPAKVNKVDIEVKDKGKVVSIGCGHYTSYVQIDGMVYWKQSDPIPQWDFDHPSIIKLPSNCQASAWVKLIQAKKFEEADKMADEMDKKMWADEKLRSDYKKAQEN